VQKRFRLRRHSDFQRVLAAGRVYAGPAMVGFAVPSAADETQPRIGVSASRRVGGAVRRNRARRRLREAARIHLTGEDSPLRARGITYDVVLIARQAALTVPFEELVREVTSAADRAGKRARPR
jgi:ribonuclease P protein component